MKATNTTYRKQIKEEKRMGKTEIPKERDARLNPGQ